MCSLVFFFSFFFFLRTIECMYIHLYECHPMFIRSILVYGETYFVYCLHDYNDYIGLFCLYLYSIIEHRLRAIARLRLSIPLLGPLRCGTGFAYMVSGPALQRLRGRRPGKKIGRPRHLCASVCLLVCLGSAAVVTRFRWFSSPSSASQSGPAAPPHSWRRWRPRQPPSDQGSCPPA